MHLLSIFLVRTRLHAAAAIQTRRPGTARYIAELDAQLQPRMPARLGHAKSMCTDLVDIQASRPHSACECACVHVYLCAHVSCTGANKQAEQYCGKVCVEGVHFGSAAVSRFF